MPTLFGGGCSINVSSVNCKQVQNAKKNITTKYVYAYIYCIYQVYNIPGIYIYVCSQVPGTKGTFEYTLSYFHTQPGTRCCYIPTLWGGCTINNWITAKKQKQQHSYIHIYIDILYRWSSGTSTYSIFYSTWYEPEIPVPAWNSAVQLEHMSRPSSTNSKRFGRGQRWIECNIMGLHSRPRGRNRFHVGGVRGTNPSAHTREVRKIKLNNGTLWANLLGIFSQAPAHSWPLDTERLRRFAPKYAPPY